MNNPKNDIIKYPKPSIFPFQGQTLEKYLTDNTIFADRYEFSFQGLTLE